MSTLAYSYSEPNKLPAGMLALAVHIAFFALLYFGINWRVEQPQGMVVDIWNSLPEVEKAPLIPPAIVPPPPPKPIGPSLPLAPPKVDIAIPEKKKPKLPEPKKEVEVKKAPEPKKKVEPKISAAELAQQAEQESRARALAAQVAATGRMVDEYVARISSKIKRNVVMPLDVQDTAQAEFKVVLLPGGSVLSARLVKPSGSRAYDEAVERAIMKSQPLPLPPDVSMFNRFRELNLTFRPKE